MVAWTVAIFFAFIYLFIDKTWLEKTKKTKHFFSLHSSMAWMAHVQQYCNLNDNKNPKKPSKKPNPSTKKIILICSNIVLTTSNRQYIQWPTMTLLIIWKYPQNDSITFRVILNGIASCILLRTKATTITMMSTSNCTGNATFSSFLIYSNYIWSSMLYALCMVFNTILAN